MDKKLSVINSKFLSHGTLGSKDLTATRKFYEKFLGIDVIQTSKISLMIRLGGNHIYAVVQDKNMQEMPRLNHNGIDVENDLEVDKSHKSVLDGAKKWGLYNISKPLEQHGTYSFHFWDRDGNCWEILSNPVDGYNWIFNMGDLEGKGHWDPELRRSRLKN
ncbi:MAG: glyoxalase [Rhodospirillaceae bacterium]|jgi:predicted lactoylglutathione lyase|nr:glyoxalase [Rhodospirillaceae bacterium]|tara:strand:- start:206 stop:688 length:483 start_codon:yes stop_codon:yes gene_type:complete